VNADRASEIVGRKEYMEKGRLAQRKSIVLLKNMIGEDSSRLLPLDSKIKIYVEDIDKEIAGRYATVTDSLEDADYAILRLQAPWEDRDGSFIEAMFHQGRLDFEETELSRILQIMRSKPTIVCIYLDRAAVIPEISAASAGLLADFGAYDDAVLDIIFGRFNPCAKLPFELPSSMKAVVDQLEDVPFDSEAPLYPFGFGLTY
jgi:beta-glucosidase